MRYVFNIWNLLGKAMDSFMLSFVIFKVLKFNPRFRNPRGLFFLSFAGLTIISYAADFLFYPVPFPVTLLLMLILGLIYSMILYTGPVYLKMVITSTCVSLFALLHFRAGLLLHSTGNEIFTPLMILIPILESIPLIIFLVYFTTVPASDLPSYYGISMSVIMVSLTMFTGLIPSDDFQSIPRTLQLQLNTLILFVVLYLYFLFFRIIKEYEGKRSYALMARQLDVEKQYLKETKEIWHEQRKLRHELKNHIFYMETLLSHKRYAELSRYFEDIYHKEYGFDLIDSGSDAVNAILNQKKAYGNSRKIPIDIQASLPPNLPFHESKLCAVISNLLDNAIEASESTTDPQIVFSIRPVEQYLHILCKNKVSHEIPENSDLITTKSGLGHGIGMQIIRSVVEEYDGIMEHHMEGEFFVVSLMLSQ